MVGPIPIEDGIWKEIVTQIKSTVGNNKTFYTDSNERDFLERIRDYRADWDLQMNQPIAGNYYPINLGINIKDKSTEFSILVDRSVGGSSIADGQLELIGGLLYDDGRGVDEALIETVCILGKCVGLTVQGKYYLRFDPLGWQVYKLHCTNVYSNVSFLYTQELEDQTVLLRLAHLYEVGEDKDLSVTATVELKRGFPNKRK